MYSLKGKKAIVTGGSRGIGKEIAKAYLEAGAEVCLMARNAAELSDAQKELSPAGTVHVLAGDVSREEDVKRAASEIASMWGQADVLVNAAGVYGPIGPVTEVDPALWRAALEINLFGTFLATHYFAAPMQKAGTGVIINFVGGGEGAYPNFSSYVSAKGGIARFTETVAAELKESGIRVNAIAPGAVNTKFLSDLIAAGPEKAGAANYERALKQKESGGISPEKAARISVFLGSDASRGITGKILSAVWDPYENFSEHEKDIMSSDVYTFRRVRPEDRGFGWDKNARS